MLAKSEASINAFVWSSSGNGVDFVNALDMIVAGAAATRQIRSMMLNSSPGICRYRGEITGIEIAFFSPSRTFKLRMRRMSTIVMMIFFGASEHQIADDTKQTIDDLYRGQ